MADEAAELKRAAQDCLIRYGADLYPEIVVAAEGARLRDVAGREVLDFTSGQMCATVGHSHPAVVAALKESAERAIHLFSGMIPEPVARLAAKIAELVPRPLKRSLFLSTGSESNEAALKMAKLVTGGHEVLALGGSWHGVTGGAAAASYASGRRGYGPTAPGAYALPEPNAYRCPVEHCRDTCDLTCLKVGLRLYDMQSSGQPAAFICEPILSAGGIIVPPEGYFAAVAEACRARGLKLIFDEAQTAFGRIGAPFAASAFGTLPDIMTVSKTLGGGIPLAAVITSDALEAEAHERGFAHYTSHVSDPLPAAVGLAVIAVIEEERLVERARQLGGYLRAGLEDLQQRYEAIGDIRGRGLLIGVELVKDRQSREPDHELGARTTERCLALGLSMNIRRRPERGAVWRIAPPLTVSRAEIDEGLAILDRALKESLDERAQG